MKRVAGADAVLAALLFLKPGVPSASEEEDQSPVHRPQVSLFFITRVHR